MVGRKVNNMAELKKILLDKIPQTILAPIVKCKAFLLTSMVFTCLYVVMYQNSMLTKSLMHFADMYSLCSVLCFLPTKVRQVFLTICYIFLYTFLFIDFFLKYKFNININPSVFLLLHETTGREVSEFVSACVVNKSMIMMMLVVVGVLTLNIVVAKIPERIISNFLIHFKQISAIVALGVVAILIYTLPRFVENKLFVKDVLSVGSVDNLERVGDVRLHIYKPIYECMYSAKALSLMNNEIAEIRNNVAVGNIDTCLNTCPVMVWIIGESYNKYHSSLYGYQLNTTPKMNLLRDSGLLVPFTDIVASQNYTSYVLKSMFSLHSEEQPSNWTSAPLFPALLKSAGYRVTFVSNQFVATVHNDFWDTSVDFFLNDSIVSSAMFDLRNEHTAQYDESLINIYKELDIMQPSDLKFDIYHLLGSHFVYSMRYPHKFSKFTADSICRPDLSRDKKTTIAEYDNSIYYNDSVTTAIFDLYNNQDAIIIVISDHGETVYDNGIDAYMRVGNISTEFPVPFLVYMTPLFVERHPDIVSRIRSASSKPFMTDDIGHIFLGLAGLKTCFYNPSRNLFSSDFDTTRVRIINGGVEYKK